MLPALYLAGELKKTKAKKEITAAMFCFNKLALAEMPLKLLLFQGRHATQDEVAASAFQAVTLDQKYGGKPVQVRVTMGKEPRHFMAIFKGRMVVFEV